MSDIKDYDLNIICEANICKANNESVGEAGVVVVHNIGVIPTKGKKSKSLISIWNSAGSKGQGFVSQLFASFVAKVTDKSCEL